MKKYEEEHYRFEKIKDSIYPWIKESLTDHQALNGKYISPKDTPIISFVGDLMIVFVIQRGEDIFEILKDNMLPPEISVEEVYQIACTNLAKNISYVISNTLYGGFGILADGHHEASSLCLKHIWNVCVEKLNDDLVIMVPSKDMVLFTTASDQERIHHMKQYGLEAYQRNRDHISKQLYCFKQKERELVVFQEVEGC